MTGSLSKGSNASAQFDPSQFRLQSDGTFRISIRGMAAMAGIASSGLSRSLRSVGTSEPLPYARALHANDLASESSLAGKGLSPVQCKVLLLYLIRTAHPCSARCSAMLRSLEEHFKEAREFVPIFPESRLSRVNAERNRKKKTSPADHLYLMQSPDTGLFKIGVSNNPERRLADLKSALGQAVFLVCALPDRKARTLEASLHDQLRKYSVLREWFSLPPSVLLPLLEALKAKGDCVLGEDPYIPVASIRRYDDISALACRGLLPVAVDADTGEYLVEWFDDCGCALIRLANREDGDDVWSLGARYRQRDSFIHSGWYLTENYTGIPSDTFCPMTDVRMLAHPMTVSCSCHWSGKLKG